MMPGSVTASPSMESTQCTRRYTWNWILPRPFSLLGEPHSANEGHEVEKRFEHHTAWLLRQPFAFGPAKNCLQSAPICLDSKTHQLVVPTLGTSRRTI